jgi:hypothetical protein
MAKTRRRKLSDRQGLVLAFARARACNGEAFPTEKEIMSAFPTFHRVTDVRQHLLSLYAKGLLSPAETRLGNTGNRIVTRWIITDAGWEKKV